MKRLLIVHYHFLPVHNVAVSKLLGYMRLLPTQGWDVSVLTRAWNSLDESDPSWGLSWEPDLEGSSGCAIHRARSRPVRRQPQPSSTAAIAQSTGNARASGRFGAFVQKATAKATRLRQMAWGDYPDEFVGWVRPAVAEGLRLAHERPIDVIVSYCPPETNHVVGRRLARLLGVPWVPFFGDLYGFLESPLPRRSFEGWAKRAWHEWCLAPAAATLAVSPAMVEYLARAYGIPSHLIHAGFDPEALEDRSARDPGADDRFILSHIGSLYPGDQRPEIFFDGLDRLLVGNPEIEGRLEVRFVGSKCEDRLRVLLQGRPSERVCSVRPKVDSRTALSLVRSSDALLAFTCTAYRDRFGTLSYPTKVFEAFGAQRPVLAVPSDGDWVDELLRETGGGTSARDADEVAETLLEWFRVWNREGHVPYAGRPERLVEFTRGRQVERLAAILDSVIRH